MRFLGLLRADKDSEAGVPPSPDFMERCGSFMEEVSRKGILVATDGLLPSAHGKRVRVAGGKSTVIDGPFTESKELVASYAILEAKDIDEAVYWTRRFLEVIGGGECEIRPIMSAEACGGGCQPAQNPAAAATRETTRPGGLPAQSTGAFLSTNPQQEPRACVS